MTKGKRLGLLAGVLAAVGLAAGIAVNYEGRQEQIRQSGETVLEVRTEEVTAVSWENESGSWAFRKEEGVWKDESDAAFPVDTAKLEALLKPLEELGAAFVIDEPENLSDYGLKKPEGSISVEAGEETVTITLGALSRMDEQRYVELGDGKVYLVTHDLLEEFGGTREDVMAHDKVPKLEDVSAIVFDGAETYTLVYDDQRESLDEEDVYFAGEVALDTEKVESYLNTLEGLSLEDWVSYTASEEDLGQFGLEEPVLTVTVRYGEEEELTLTLGLDPENDEDSESVTGYVRLNDSENIYRIGGGTYQKLRKAGVDDLRHRELFSGDTQRVTALKAEVDGETYPFLREEDVWYMGETEFDAQEVLRALETVEIEDFSPRETDGKLELKVTLTLEAGETGEKEMEVAFYRLDGESCAVTVDGEKAGTVARKEMVTLREAVNAVALAG